MNTTTPDPQDAQRGALISEHPHPRPALRQLAGTLVRLGLVGIVLGAVGLLLLAVIHALPLLVLMALFLAALSIPLLQAAVMHPHITVYERGLRLKPLIGPGIWVPWETVVRVEDHTLIRRGAEKDRQREHFGQLIVVEGALPRLFVVVGGLAGLGWRVRAFGISTTSHTEYDALLNTIQRHKPHP
ncbi:MAG: hypothetical protein JXQ72_16960 [Anaerolineae bacterium]|nr:hypothetical protein [Anaerolineae bacterium]